METPILFPLEPDVFLEKLRGLIVETVSKQLREQQLNVQPVPNGLTTHPLLSLKDVCALFRISKPTVYDWIAHGKLKPFKVRGKVYFLQADIHSLFEGSAPAESTATEQ